MKEGSLLSRYMIADNYLQFYFKFIKPVAKQIDNGDFNRRPTEALNVANFNIWLGFAFERFCRKYHRVIAEILGFSGVTYQYGAYFNRSANKAIPGFQIDLIFDRKDHVYTICEIKYQTSKVGTNIIQQMDQKLELFQGKKNHSIQKVLICVEGIDQSLESRFYFDRVITIEELFDLKYWR